MKEIGEAREMRTCVTAAAGSKGQRLSRVYSSYMPYMNTCMSAHLDSCHEARTAPGMRQHTGHQRSPLFEHKDMRVSWRQREHQAMLLLTMPWFGGRCTRPPTHAHRCTRCCEGSAGAAARHPSPSTPAEFRHSWRPGSTASAARREGSTCQPRSHLSTPFSSRSRLS